MTTLLKWLRLRGSQTGLPIGDSPARQEQVPNRTRPELIAELRAEISQLQQDLIARDSGDARVAPINAPPRNEKSVANIERSLARAQSKLATYQARI